MANNLPNQSFETIIRALEHVSPGVGLMPGTNLRRVKLDRKLADAYGMGIPPGFEGWPAHDAEVKAICLTLGPLGMEPEHTFYGWTITQAVTNAVETLLRGKHQA